MNGDLRGYNKGNGWRRRLSSVTALSGGLILIASVAAMAQSADQPPQTAAQPAQTTGQNPQTTGPQPEEIVVTGSRVIRNGYQAPTPVTVLSKLDIDRDAPVNIAEFINKLPAFSNSPSSTNQSASIGDGNQGVNNLNLRSLGANRTLVLLDGVRVAASSISGFYNNGGSVDINEFPDSLVSRVDVVTGGASSVYGSDALAGVVNFILDKNFTGVKGSIEGGETTYGDDRTGALSIAAGTDFAGGRGHFLLSGSDNYTAGIPRAGVRSWVAQSYSSIYNPAYTPTNGQPYYLIRDHVGTSAYAPGGLITAGPLMGTTFGPGGVLGRFVYGNPNDGFSMSGGDWQETSGAVGGSLGTESGLDSRVARGNLFGRVSYDVTDDIQAYGQIDYASTRASSECCQPLLSATITQDNAFLPPAILAQMQAHGVQSFPLGTLITQQLGAVTQREFTQFLAGLKGDFDALGTNWKWNLYGTQTQTRAGINTTGDINVAHYNLAVDSVINPLTGAPVCRSTLTNPNNGCVAYNPFGTGVNSQAANNYVFQNGGLDQIITEDVVDLELNGEPFETWAGPVSVAFGLQHRKESVRGYTDAVDEASELYTGNYQATFGAYDVTEGFFETDIPLAKDMSWAKSLDLNAALRETDYSTSGLVTTWKVGGVYAPIDDIRFRVTRSLDIRAPNLGELFSAGETGEGQVQDPFKGNATTSYLLVSKGNPALAPEEANSTGVGVVVQPSFLPGFSASVDYYTINIDGAIAQEGAQAEIDDCYAGNKIFCSLITRNAAGNLQYIYNSPTNSGSARTNGLDIEVSYSRDISDFVPDWQGTLSIRALGTHIFNLITTTPDGVQQQGAGVLGGEMYPIPVAPKWRYSVTLAYDSDAFSTSWTGRGFSAGVQSTNFIQCSSGCPSVTSPNFTIDNNQLPGAFYMDLSFTAHLQHWTGYNSDVFLTIENVANNNPTGVAFLYYAPGAYDTLGRVFRGGFRFKLGGETAEPKESDAYVPPPPAPVLPAAPHSYLVFFDFNKSDLSSQAAAIVDQAAKNAAPAKVTQLTVTGHTDTVGSDAYNMRLSRRRAEAVAAQLEKDGIRSSEIEIVAKGKRDLLVPTADGVKEPQNRRVQIVYDGAASS